MSISVHPFNPSASLSRYVKMYLFAEVENADYHEALITPRGYHALTIVYRRGNSSDFAHIDFNPGIEPPKSQDDGMYLIGHYTKSFTARSWGKFSLMYVVFQPAGTALFFGNNQHLFTDACVPIADFEREIDVEGVMERLAVARQYQERVGIIERVLSSLLKKRANKFVNQFGSVADWIIAHRGNISVTQIASECGMSMRTLDRRFTEIIGVTPKQYTKIVRFRNVLHYLQEAREVPDWNMLLQQANYYDQAHFIHDFRDFTGRSPSSFLSLDRAFDDTFVKVIK